MNLANLDLTLSAKLFAALFAIMNPLTIIPVFLSLTADRSPAERRSTMLVLNATVALGCLICAVGGRFVLGVFGIDVTHFQLAGGLIVLLLALSMLSGEEHSAHAGTPAEKQTFSSASSLGVYPLGIPLSIGPGTMTTIIIFSQAGAHPGGEAGFYLALVGYVIFFGACMAAAPALSSLLSPTALSISKRLMGIVLAAIAMEMISNALGHLFPAWTAR
ncbi:MarC family protein [Xanthobacter autotrophicus DSM 431]|uniref:MarC family protein n=1 Tax=Xanthobacter nonsaccharivorans TaxID=3119912 RepID=UPI00372A55B0